MDSEDLLQELLEPGEKVLWTDRPHGLLGFVKASCGRNYVPWWFVSFAFVLVVTLSAAAIAFVMLNAAEITALRGKSIVQDPSDLLKTTLFVGLPLLPAVVAIAITITRAHAMLYAVTDRRRGFVVAGDWTIWFDLPEASRIQVRGGDIDLGIRSPWQWKRKGAAFRAHPARVLFRGVSDPHVAVEAVRQAASVAK